VGKPQMSTASSTGRLTPSVTSMTGVRRRHLSTTGKILMIASAWPGPSFPSSMAVCMHAKTCCNKPVIVNTTAVTSGVVMFARNITEAAIGVRVLTNHVALPNSCAVPSNKGVREAEHQVCHRQHNSQNLRDDQSVLWRNLDSAQRAGPHKPALLQ
jgi:hypothetical protein